MDMNSRQNLMKRLQLQSFAMDDVILFLDSHPDNQMALDYYNKFRALRDETFEQYTRTCGPISAMQADVTDRWTWVDTPWPWEGEK